MNVLGEVSNTFKRDDEIDEAEKDSMADTMKNKIQKYTKEEEKTIKQGWELHRRCVGNSNFDDIKNQDNWVQMMFVHFSRDKHQTAKAITVVDATLEEIAASVFTGRVRYCRSTNKTITDINVRLASRHKLYHNTTRDFGIPGFAPRDARCKMIWARGDDGEMVITITDTEDLKEEYPVKQGSVLMSAQSVWFLKTIDPVGNVPQTHVTYTTRMDMKGNIPFTLRAKLASKSLNFTSIQRKHFDKSLEIDKFYRHKIVKKLRKLKVAETEKAETFNKLFATVEGQLVVEGAFPLSDTWQKINGKGRGWGKTSMKVHAELEEVAAFFWHFESRANIETTCDEERVIESKSGDWDYVVMRRQKQRVFRNNMKLYKITNDMIVITMDALAVKEATQETGLSTTGTIRNIFSTTTRKLNKNTRNPKKTRGAKEKVAIRLIRKRKFNTTIELVTKLILGKGVSDGATKLYLEKHLDEYTEVQRYFVNLLPLDKMTKEAGETLGADLVWDGGQLNGHHSRKEREKHVEEVCKRSQALKEVVKKYPWFVTMLKRARICDFAINSSNSTKLECVEEKQARVIGNNLMPCLKSRKLITAGVDVWRLQNKAVGELFEEFPWMEDLFVAIGKGVIKTAPWGVILRVYIGAMTSMLDLLTDLYVTYMFWSAGKLGYYKASLASLAASMFVQSFLVILQNKTLGVQAVLYECLPILLGYKPALDAYRVATGAKQKVGTAFHPKVEMTFMKGTEMFSEAIPGVIIQLMAIATANEEEKIATAAWASLALSALSTGFISATMSYDWDTDPQSRGKN